jgi:hypothetical protein
LSRPEGGGGFVSEKGHAEGERKLGGRIILCGAEEPHLLDEIDQDENGELEG